MNSRIVRSRHLLPSQIDLVVGVPRSGLVAGNFLALALNVPLTDVAGLLEGRLMEAGVTKQSPDFQRALADERNVVVIDDTVSSGRSLRHVRKRIEQSGLKGNFTYCCVYGILNSHPDADVVMEAVGLPMPCEWNVMHTDILGESCVDIDGVLCSNCPPEDDDDGPRYLEFLRTVHPLYKPTKKIAYLVTGRKKKYRRQTEEWLARHGIEYGELIMFDDNGTNAEHGHHKADVYRDLKAALFIESELDQAETIAKLSGKRVLCVETHHLITPEFSYQSVAQSLKLVPTYVRKGWGGLPHGNLSGLKIRFRQTFGDSLYQSLKRLARR